MTAYSTESIADAIREKAAELNKLMKQAEDNHAITCRLDISEGPSEVEVKMWLRREL